MDIVWIIILVPLIYFATVILISAIQAMMTRGKGKRVLCVPVLAKVNTKMTFYRQLVIFLELPRPNDVQTAHSFNVRSASSTSV